MSPDQQIIALMLPLTALLLSAGLGLHFMSDRQTLGVGHWAAGHLSFFAGLALIAFRDHPTPSLNGAAGVACVVAGLLAVRLGLRRFLGKGALGLHWWGLLLGVVGFNALYFDLPPVHLRIAGNTAAVAVVTLGLGWEFLRSGMDVLHRWAGGALCLFIALYLGARALSIAVDSGVTAPLAGGLHGAWAFMAMIVWTRPMRW